MLKRETSNPSRFENRLHRCPRFCNRTLRTISLGMRDLRSHWHQKMDLSCRSNSVKSPFSKVPLEEVFKDRIQLRRDKLTKTCRPKTGTSKWNSKVLTTLRNWTIIINRWPWMHKDHELEFSQCRSPKTQNDQPQALIIDNPTAEVNPPNRWPSSKLIGVEQAWDKLVKIFYQNEDFNT